MKAIILILLSFNLSAQQFNIKQSLLAGGFGLISGSSWGLNQRLNHHYDGFQKQYPNANPRYWNPSISWTNKYNNGIPELGRNKKLIWFTDAQHLTNSITQVSGVCGGVTIGIGSHKKWWKYLVDAGCFSLGYIIGNALTYK